MDNYIFVPIYLNYSQFFMDKPLNFSLKELIREVKVLFLKKDKLLTSLYQLPTIKSPFRHNVKQSISESLEKLMGMNFQVSMKVTEFYVFNGNGDGIKSKSVLSFHVVFLKTDEISSRSQLNGFNGEFIPMTEISRLNIDDISKEYIFHLKKWIEQDCNTRNSLQKWFNSPYNKEIRMVGQECIVGPLNKEIKQKSTSLDTINYKIPRPQSANIESFNKKQADSLDQLTQKYDKRLMSNSGGMKITLKNKISKHKSKSMTAAGPIAAMPLNESNDENVVIKNPLEHRSLSYHCQSDLVVENPFWNKRKPDYNQINPNVESLLKNKEHIIRNRSWSFDYPLHYASYKGDLSQVSPLIAKGYTCTQRDQVGWTPIHYAVWYGNKEIVSFFIQSHVVSVNTRTVDSWTPLHIAIFKGHVDIASMLLKQPDIDTTLTIFTGEDARSLANKYKQQSIVNLLKSMIQKPTKYPVYLMDNTVKYLVLTRGMNTTFQSLKCQMIEILNIPNDCVDIFNFWISVKAQKLSIKYSLIPLQCFGDLSISLKDLNLDDMKIFWKRNVLLNLDTERRVKDVTIISLLFEEALQNFTTKSLYPCDTQDIILLCSILLYLYLPKSKEKLTKSNRRAFSLSRMGRPLSMFSSNPDVSSGNLSSSTQTLKYFDSSSLKLSGNQVLDKSLIVEIRKRQAKQFLSNEKNLAQITPKKKMKNSKINYPESILNQFLASSFSYKYFSIEDIKFRFLTLCWNLTLYGCAYFEVEIKLEPSIPYINCIFAVNDMGIYIMHSKNKSLIQNYKYSSINWNSNVDGKSMTIFTKRKANLAIKCKHSAMIAQLMLKLQAMNPN